MIVCLWSQKQSESRHKPPKTTQRLVTIYNLFRANSVWLTQ